MTHRARGRGVEGVRHRRPRGHRLAFYVPVLGVGGAETVVLRLANELVSRGHAVDVVLAKAGGTLVASLDPRVRVVDLEARRPAAASKTWRLARYLRRERPAVLFALVDLVNTATIARILSGSPTSVLIGVHNHVTSQTGQGTLGRVRRLIIRLTYPWADGVMAPSLGVAADVERLSRRRRFRVDVAFNPVVDADLRRRAAKPVDHPFLSPAHDRAAPVIIAVGRLVAQKRFDVLLRAVAELRAERDVRLVIVGGPGGEPQTEKLLARLVAELGLTEVCDLPGWVAAPEAWMAAGDLLVLSSAFEGFGNVLAEGLAVGASIVSTDCPSGPAEILDGGTFGRLVAVGDASALAAAIGAALDEPADPAFQRAGAERYTTAAAADRYLEIATRSRRS